jgi:hypothetical protein
VRIHHIVVPSHQCKSTRFFFFSRTTGPYSFLILRKSMYKSRAPSPKEKCQIHFSSTFRSGEQTFIVGCPVKIKTGRRRAWILKNSPLLVFYNTDLTLATQLSQYLLVDDLKENTSKRKETNQASLRLDALRMDARPMDSSMRSSRGLHGAGSANACFALCRAAATIMGCCCCLRWSSS